MLQKTNFKHANLHSQKLEERLRKAAASGKAGKVRHHLQEYLKSYDCRLTSVEQAYRNLKKHLRPSKSALPTIAEEINAWEGTDEKVIVDFKAKSNGDFRPICRFGIRNKSLQILVDSALRCVSETASNQFAMHGGRDAAIVEVVKRLKDGHCWTAEFDIANFYHSLDEEAVISTLPLPSRVIERVILSRSRSLGVGNAYHWYGNAKTEDEKAEVDAIVQGDLVAVRQGIAQGAAGSPLVAEIMLAGVLAKLPDSERVIAYADNFLIAAKDENDCQSLSKALCKNLEQSPAGQLHPYVRSISAPGQSFDFLGYELATVGQDIRIRPSAKNLSKFNDKVAALLARLVDGTRSTEERVKAGMDLKRYVSNWSGAFRLWPGAVVEKSKIHDRIKAEFKSMKIIPTKQPQPPTP